jgi:hypothetical protein
LPHAYNAAEWIIAIGTIISVVFVAIQSYLIRQSLETPFRANVQGFILESCKSYVSSHGIFKDDVARVASLAVNLSLLHKREIEENLGLDVVGESAVDLRYLLSSTFLPGCDLDRSIEFWSAAAENKSLLGSFFEWNGPPLCGHSQPLGLTALAGSLSELEALTTDSFQEAAGAAKENLSSFTYELALRGEKYMELQRLLDSVNASCTKEMRAE